MKGNSYREWVCNWTNHLIFSLDKVNGAKVFKPCMSIIKHDLRMGLFLLPHVVLSTITSKNTERIHVEIMAVLNSVVETEKVSEFKTSCTQTVFSVLDFLHLWSSNVVNYNYSGNNTDSMEGDVQSVKLFLEKIPKDVIAASSFHCNALSRSLMYYEQYIEQQKSDIEVHLEFLQKIYYCLDEPDGISGVAATRKKSTSLKEQIIEHESSGDNLLFFFLFHFRCYKVYNFIIFVSGMRKKV